MPKRFLLPIEDEHIILRLLEKADLPLTLSWRNQDHIRKWFLNTDVITEEKHYAWFERYDQLDNDFVFIIMAKDLGNIPVGQISLYGIDWQVESAEYGRLMIGNPAAKGKGYAKQATRLLLKYGFEHMGLKEINLEVKEDNAPAIAIYRATGFTETSRKEGLILMTVDPNDHDEKHLMDNAENKQSEHLLKQSPDQWWQQWDQPGIAKAITEYWQNDRTGFEPLHRQNLARLVSAYYQPSMASVLEVGCGNGLVYKELVPGVIKNGQYTGVDVSDEMLKLAHKNFPAGNFLHGDIFDLQFLDSSFDLVLSFEVVIHLPEIETPIAEMLRVAGQMLIFTAWVSKEEKQTLIQTHIKNVKFIHHYYEHKKVLDVIHQKAGKRQHYIEVRPLTDGTWAYVVFLNRNGQDQVIPFEGFLVQFLERYKKVHY